MPRSWPPRRGRPSGPGRPSWGRRGRRRSCLVARESGIRQETIDESGPPVGVRVGEEGGRLGVGRYGPDEVERDATEEGRVVGRR